MKHNYSLSVLVVALLLLCANANAQQSKTPSANQAQHSDPTIQTGFFELVQRNAQGILEHINVNFAMFPVPVTSSFTLELSTPNPTMFMANITDEKGAVVTQWTPKEMSYYYRNVIDVAALPAGSYKLNIFGATSPALLKSVPFTKAQNRK